MCGDQDGAAPADVHDTQDTAVCHRPFGCAAQPIRPNYMQLHGNKHLANLSCSTLENAKADRLGYSRHGCAKRILDVVSFHKPRLAYV